MVDVALRRRGVNDYGDYLLLVMIRGHGGGAGCPKLIERRFESRESTSLEGRPVFA